jgi:hypothetical protein
MSRNKKKVIQKMNQLIDKLPKGKARDELSKKLLELKLEPQDQPLRHSFEWYTTTT